MTEPILPTQWSAFRAVTGEQRIRVAMLESAERDLAFALRFPGNPRAIALAARAHDWIASGDMAWAYSFERICEALGQDAGYLRRGLLGKGGSHGQDADQAADEARALREGREAEGRETRQVDDPGTAGSDP